MGQGDKRSTEDRIERSTFEVWAHEYHNIMTTESTNLHTTKLTYFFKKLHVFDVDSIVPGKRRRTTENKMERRMPTRFAKNWTESGRGDGQAMWRRKIISHTGDPT